MAAPVLETLSRLPALEHSDRRFPWLATVAFLEVNGHTLDHPAQKEAVPLVTVVARGATGVQACARQLRRWAHS
ncbi:hypothetical protein [Actinacidiphila glaucinigra]|uniref:Death on curing protein n=1 Tax=Actinacidiphila glaucinigra TaxID=235986 RepID=A0A239IQJ8_9ACTN|nr:hypothetical protein [Actinacidiphila glaucinigra]SNS95672.1 death on curing protein [Actinacidiphila glaucinigra]